MQRNPWTIPALASLLAVSLLLHLWTFYTLYRTRRLVREQIVLLEREVSAAQGATARFEVPIRQALPISATIPIDRQLTVPISTTIAISDEISFPILGTELPLPLNVDVPIRTEVPIDVQTSVPISTTIDVNLLVPVEIPIKDTPLAAYLARLQQALARLGQEL